MKKNTLLSMGLIIVVAGCNSGTNSNPVVAPAGGFSGGEFGPISPTLYQNVFSNKQPKNTTQTNSKSNLSGGTADADTAAATGLIAAVFPPAALVLGPISVIAGFAAGNQTAAQINQINNQLNTQETQITGIYSTLNSSYNYFITQTKSSSLSQFETNYASWYNSTVGVSFFYGYGVSSTQISPINGAQISSWYQGYMNNILSSAPPASQINAPSQNTVTLLNSVATNKSQMSTINSYVTGTPTIGSINLILNIIDNASMTATSSTTNQVVVSANNTSSTSQLLTSAKVVLSDNLPTASSPNSSFINLVESYNNFVNMVYLDNLTTLQATYALEATNNYLNYLNYVASLKSKTELSQICPIEGNSPSSTNFFNTVNFYAGSGCSTNVAPTVYYPNGFNGGNSVALNINNAESAFVFAQQQLTELYARRINLLYSQTVGFIYSDHAYPGQGVNLTGGETNLSSGMNGLLSSTPQIKTMQSSLPNVAMIGGAWVDSLNLYQYPITNIDFNSNQMEASITQQLATNPGLYPVIPAMNAQNYPPAYQNIQTGYYDGESITAYNNTASSSTTPFNFNQYCITASGLSFYESGSSIMCNIWSSANYYMSYEMIGGGENVENIFKLYSYENSSNIASYNTSQVSNSPLTLAVSDSKYQSFHVYVNPQSNLVDNFNLISSSGPTSNPTAQSSPSFITTQTNPLIMSNTGLSEAGNGYNTAAMQVTLPDGFVYPFYLVVYSAFNQLTQATSEVVALGCPYNIINSASCTPSSTSLYPFGFGGLVGGNSGAVLYVTTPAGNNYYIYATYNQNLISKSDNSGTRAVYLGIDQG